MSDTEKKTKAEQDADAVEAQLEEAGVARTVLNVSDDQSSEEATDESVVNDKENADSLEKEKTDSVKPKDEESEESEESVEEENEQETEDDEDLKIKGDKPTPDDWKNVRNIVRDLKSRIKSLETGVSEKPVEKPEEKKPNISDGEVFTIAVDAQVDKFKDATKSKSLLKQAQDFIDEMTPDRVLKVIRQAKNGEFGDNSADVLIMARDALVEANARETIKSKEESEQANKLAENHKQVSESFKNVAEKYPELDDKNNPALIEFARKWRTQYLGEVDKTGGLVKPGPLAGMLTSTTNWPEVVAELIINAFKASGGKIEPNSKGKQTYVPDAGGQVINNRGGDKITSDIESGLRKMGNIRKG